MSCNEKGLTLKLILLQKNSSSFEDFLKSATEEFFNKNFDTFKGSSDNFIIDFAATLSIVKAGLITYYADIGQLKNMKKLSSIDELNVFQNEFKKLSKQPPKSDPSKQEQPDPDSDQAEGIGTPTDFLKIDEFGDLIKPDEEVLYQDFSEINFSQEDTTRYERIVEFDEKRFNGISENHLKFQKFFKNELFKSTVIDFSLLSGENTKIISSTKIDKNIKRKINQFADDAIETFSSSESYKQYIANNKLEDNIESKRRFLRGLLLTSDNAKNKPDAYNKLVFALDFDYLLNTYETDNVFRKINDKYKLLVRSKLSDNIIIAKDEINADKQASDFYRFIIENFNLVDNEGNDIPNVFLSTKMIGYFLPNVFNNSKWLGINPIKEFEEIINDLIKEGDLKRIDNLVARTLKQKLFDSNTGLVNASGSSSVVSALVSEMISIADNIPLQIKSSDDSVFELTEGKLTTGTRNRIIDSIENYLLTSYSSNANTVLNDLVRRDKNEYQIGNTVFNITTKKDLTFSELELFKLLTGIELTEDLLSTLEQVYDKGEVDSFVSNVRQVLENYAYFISSLNKKSKNKKAKIRTEAFSKNVDKSEVEKEAENLIASKNNNRVIVDRSKLSIIKIKGAENVFDTIQFLKDTLYQMSPRATYGNSEGNQAARLNPSNILSQYKALLNRFRKYPDSLLKDNIFFTNPDTIDRFYKLDGAITHYQGISHKNFSIKDNLDVEINFMYFQQLMKSEREKGKAQAFITPAVYSDKSYDGSALINIDNAEVTAEAIEESKSKHFETISKYYLGLEQSILNDYKSVYIDITANTLVELNNQLKTKFKNTPNWFQQVSIDFSNNNLEAIEKLHYQNVDVAKEQSPIQTKLIEKVNNFRTRKAYDKYIATKIANDVRLKNESKFKLDRNVMAYLKSEMSGLTEKQVSELDEFLIDPANPDLGAKISITKDGKTKYHPAYLKYFYDWNLYSENLVNAGFGIVYLDGSIEKWIKRMNGVSSPIKKFTHGLKNGIPEEGVEIVIEDPTLPIQFATSASSDNGIEVKEIYDGAAFFTSSHMRKRINSLGKEFGMQAGVNHKDFNQGIDYTNGHVANDKRVAFHITNELIRNSRGDQERDFYQINKLLLSKIDFDTPLELNNKEIVTYSYNPETGKIQRHELVGEFRNMFEIWEHMGGENTIKFDTNGIMSAEYESQQYSFNYSKFDTLEPEVQTSDKLPIDAAGNLTNVADIIVMLEEDIENIRHKYVQGLILKSSRKRGNKNINSIDALKEAFIDPKKIAQSKQNYLNLGIQLSTDKDYQDKELTLSSQSIGAIALEGLAVDDEKDAYLALKEIIKESLPSRLTDIIDNSNDKALLKKEASKIIEQSVKSTEIGSIANQIYNYAKNNLEGNIPFDHPQIYKLLVSTINSYVSGTALKQKLSGSQLVLVPPTKILRFGTEAITNEDFWWRVNNNDDFVKSELIKFAKRVGYEQEISENKSTRSIYNELNKNVLDFKNILFSTFRDELKAAELKLPNATGQLVDYDKPGSPVYELMVQYRLRTTTNKAKLRNDIDRYLLSLRDKVVESKGYKHFDKDGNLLYESVPGETIAPFINLSKYKQYGIKESMSVGQVRFLLQAEKVPSEVRRDFEYQLLSTNERIPLQSLASMMTNKTVGFLYSMQSSAMVNNKHQALTGGDFDVDKTNHTVFAVENGKVVGWKEKMDNDFAKWDAKFEDVIEYINTLKPKEKLLALKNYLLYKKMKTTLNPATTIVRETPINTNTIGKLSRIKNNLNSVYTLFDENTPSYRSYMKYENQSAAAVVGIAANAIKTLAVIHHAYHDTFKQIAESKDESEKAALLKTLGFPGIVRDGINYRLVADLNFSMFKGDELFNILNALEGNAYNTGDINDILQKYTSNIKQYDFLGELLNAAVDNAKELKLNKINAGPVTARIWVTLSMLGMSPEKIGDIMIKEEVDMIIKMAEKSFRKKENKSLTDIIDAILDNPLESKKKFDDEISDKKPFRYWISKVLYEYNIFNITDEMVKNVKVSDAYKTYTVAGKEKKIKNDKVAKKRKYIDDNLETLVLQFDKEKQKKIVDKLNDSTGSKKAFLRSVVKTLNDFKTFIENNEELKSFSELGRDPDEAKANLDFIRTIDKDSQPINILITALGINQGLGSNEYKTLNLKYKIEAHYNAVMADVSINSQLDFFAFITDENYRKNIISNYDKGKNLVNIFYVLSKSPHFMESYKTMVKANKWGTTISFKLRELDNLINILDKEDYISKLKLNESDYNRLINMLDEMAIDSYYQNSEVVLNSIPSTIMINKGEYQVKRNLPGTLNLKSDTDRQLFVDFMNNYIIPYLKTRLPNNEFLKAIEKSNSKKNGFGSVQQVYRLIFDPNSMTNDSQLTRQMMFKEGLNKLNNPMTIKAGGNQMNFNPLEYLIHYNRIVNNDSMSSQAFTRYIPAVKANTDYWEALSEMNLKVQDIFTTNNAIGEDIKKYLVVKYNLAPYIDLRQFEDNERPIPNPVYKVRKGGKTVVMSSGKELRLNKNYVNFGIGYRGFIFDTAESYSSEQDFVDEILELITECK